ncbi:hypothetical protein K438DRAFT_2155427 [Mycena galopus ATCC 62051]|nr:hypothetical protein K438DRAFT_2155427 [Mycena galopus ATCC 62051]
MSSSVQSAGPIASPLLIGSLLNFFFFGALLAQVYVYRICFPKDSRRIKFLVYSLLLMTTLDTCLNASDAIFWYSTSFGDFVRFADPRDSSFYSPIMGAVIATVAHLFFSYRILVIRRTVWPLCILITLISMAQLAGGMGSGILSFIQEYKVYDFNADDIIGLHTRTHAVLLYLWLTGAPVADVLIAIAMTTLLLKADMHSATRDVVKDIVHLILETNAFSAAVALVALFVFVGFPNTPYTGCPLLILPGIYANTLLVTLNNRAIIRRNRAEQSTAHCVERSIAPGDSVSGAGSVESVPTFARPSEEHPRTSRVRSSLATTLRDEQGCESHKNDAGNQVRNFL